MTTLLLITVATLEPECYSIKVDQQRVEQPDVVMEMVGLLVSITPNAPFPISRILPIANELSIPAKER